MMAVPSHTLVNVDVLDAAKGAALFGARTRALLGVSAAEFLAHYDAGDAWDTYGHSAVSELSMLVPFAR
jgi:hypothetical protein